MQPPVPVPQGALSSSASFSFSPNPQLVQNAQNQPAKSDTPATGTQAAPVSSALTISQPGQMPVHNSSNFTVNASTTPNFAPITSWMPATPSFPMCSGSSGTPGAPAHPGLVPSVQKITASAAADYPSPAVPGPSAPVSLNPAVQQTYPPYASLAPMVSSPRGFWMQHHPIGGFPRPPFVPYPIIYPGPFPSTSGGLPQGIGESTYDKPAGFKEEPDQVTVQPTPVSVEQLAGTDWALVTTNDGKNITATAKPRLVAGRSLVVPGSSSALDLIKKLQDFGAPSTSTVPVMPVTAANDLNGSKVVDVKGLQSTNNRDKLKDDNGDGNISDSSSDYEDAVTGPSKEVCIMQFKEMLNELGVAPFSKWEKELPKIVFDPRFKAIPSHSARRSLFEHYVKTRAEEECREKRAAQKVAVEGFKKLLDEASEDIDHNTNYQSFKRKWASDPRFEVLDRKDRELLLNERVLLKRAAEDKARAIRAAASSSFKAMLKEKGDINVNSRWSRVKDSLRNDPRYKSVKHEDREVLFNEYISELKAVDEKAERKEKVRKEEEDKLKERERELRKRKEREEQEMERLEKDPQGRAANPDLDSSDMEKLFREHIKMLFERCSNDFRSLLSEVITQDAAAQETQGGKTVLNSWSTAKLLLKPDPRYNKMPRKEREALWRRHAEDMLRKQKSATDQEEEKHTDAKGRSSAGDYGRYTSERRWIFPS
ncbi:ARM repeat superfamily protein isoform 1 [Hibiscus syriacus]|uniref:ARM repeat superfamily protein isoform 1 n=1 Tax=Hibiscus syriacus TaxID=106335 RepID=A0A6A3B1N6_HIBSY|nr:ARM repeat superfamily protein isoform 1 [Hibiscus syriacus]